MYLNKAIVIGNLTRDPELRSLPSGIKVCTFSLATNRVWKDKNGARQESADYHNVVVFGRQAETVAQYMKKGNSILVEGRMQTRSWDDKTSGEKKYPHRDRRRSHSVRTEGGQCRRQPTKHGRLGP